MGFTLAGAEGAGFEGLIPELQGFTQLGHTLLCHLLTGRLDLSSFKTGVLKLTYICIRITREFVKTQISVLTPRVRDSVGLERGLRLCISNRFLADADVTVWG